MGSCIIHAILPVRYVSGSGGEGERVYKMRNAKKSFLATVAAGVLAAGVLCHVEAQWLQRQPQTAEEALHWVGVTGGFAGQQDFNSAAGTLHRSGRPDLALSLGAYFPEYAWNNPYLSGLLFAPPGARAAGGGGFRGPTQARPFLIEAIRPEWPGLRVGLAWLPGHEPQGGAVDIFVTADLASPAWEPLHREPIPPQALAAGAHSFTLDLSQYPHLALRAFFTAGDLGDSDNDGIPDAWERLIYKTDPLKWDSMRPPTAPPYGVWQQAAALHTTTRAVFALICQCQV